MSRTRPIVQEYVGCLLSMVRATLYDHPVYAEAINQEALDEALTRVHELLIREENKNATRQKGARLHISEVGE